MQRSKRKKSGVGRRASVLLRVRPELADWLAGAASGSNMSRSRVMEGWLELLPKLVEIDRAKYDSGERVGREVAMKALAQQVVGELLRLRLVNDVLRDGLDCYHYEQELVEKDRRAAEELR